MIRNLCSFSGGLVLLVTHVAACSGTGDANPGGTRVLQDGGDSDSSRDSRPCEEQARDVAGYDGDKDGRDGGAYAHALWHCRLSAQPSREIMCEEDRACREKAWPRVQERVDAKYLPAELNLFLSDIAQQCVKACAPALDTCASSVEVPDGGQNSNAANVQHQTDIAARCTATESSECEQALIGRANVDYWQSAVLMANAKSTPGDYLGLSRDRRAKLTKARQDSAYALALCSEKDDDGDWVPNAKDQCPDTPSLAPTDENGCPVAPPKGPDGASVRAHLAKMGIAIDPRCSGASVPERIPAGAYHYVQELERGKFILAGRVANQPKGCPLYYVFEIEEVSPNKRFGYSVVFKEAEAEPRLFDQDRPVPEGYIQFNPKPNETGMRGRLGSVPLKTHIRFRVRPVNGGGLTGGWSEWWDVPDPVMCRRLGASCGGAK